MALIRGTRLGPYEIERLLGAGGMGEVYLARDTRLDRAVAIKVIRTSATPSTAMHERFQREARVISRLSHPNICTLYDVGSFEGTEFLVMEYLDGETLDSRFSRQKLRTSHGDVAGRTPPRVALPIEETLRIATQLAEALGAAHRAGVVHRDLKPSNIMLTRAGVKVLDFGLARFQPPIALSGADPASTVTAAPLTQEGLLVGTLPFMAPEQLEGRAIDARTDIFALGTIVYEMATGRRAFSADSEAGLIAAILQCEPPPITDEEPRTPRSLEQLVRKCLAKDPAARWQSASDIADQLRWITPAEGTAPRSTARALLGRRRWWTVAAIALSLAGATGVALWQRANPGQPRPTAGNPRFTKVTFVGDVGAADLSPDGKTVAYASRVNGEVRVFVRDLSGDRSHEIWKGQNLWAIRWLPNGMDLLLGQPNSLILRLSRYGGAPRKILQGASGYIAVGPSAAEFVHSVEDLAGYQISDIDGMRSRTVSLQSFSWLLALDWNRVTNRILLLSVERDGRYVVRSTTPEGTDEQRHYADTDQLHAMCASPSSGAIYLLRERNDVTEILKLSSSATHELSSVILTSVADSVASRSCRISDRGDLMLYARKIAYANIWRFDLRTPMKAAVPLTRGTALLQVPRVAPDGQIVATSGRGPNSRVVRIPANGGEPVQVTSGTVGILSPSGRRLAFVSARTTQYRVWTSDADGLGATEVRDAVTANHATITWLPDGRLAWQTADGMNYRIRNLETGQAEVLAHPDVEGYLFHPHFSPTNDQVAVFWIRERTGLYILSWPSRQTRFLAPDLAPIGWSDDGEWIYALQALQPFKAQDSTSRLVRVSARTSRVESVGSFPRGYLTHDACSLTPDRQAIICALTEENSDAWIVEDLERPSP